MLPYLGDHGMYWVSYVKFDILFLNVALTNTAAQSQKAVAAYFLSNCLLFK